MAVSISISITQNSQSIANNTSNVTVKVNYSWTYGSFNRNSTTKYVKINGTKYSFNDADINTNATTSGSGTLYTKTLNIAHDSDGTGEVDVYAYVTTGVSSGTLTKSASKTLSTIARVSTVSATSATIGSASTISISRKSSSFLHTLKYSLGDKSGTIATKTSSTSVKWTLPSGLYSELNTVLSKSGTITCYTYTSGGTYVGKDTCSFTAKLDSTNASKVSATSAVIGAKSTLTISRKYSGFKHTLTYSIGDLSGTIASGTTSTSLTWTLPTSIYALIPNATSKSGTITCKTYNSGNDLVGTTTCTFTASTSSATCAPTLSPTVKDVNSTTIALTGDSNKLIKYYSTAAITFGAAARNSATLASKKVTNSGKYRTTDGNFANVTSGSFVFTTTDSRKYSASKTITKTLINYIKLTCSFKANATIDGTATINISGNYFNGSFGAVSNTLTVQYRYCESGGTYSAWTAATATKSGNTYSAKVNITGLDYQKAYTIQARAIDKLATVTPSAKTVKATPIFDWGNNDFNHNTNVTLANNKAIQGFDTDGNVVNLVFINKDDNMIVGGGDYPPNRMVIRAKKGIYFTSENSGLTGREYGVNKVLWSGVNVMGADDTITLSEAISAQPNGIILAWSYQSNGAGYNQNWNYKFIPKNHTALHSGGGVNSLMASAGSIYNKYCYISDTTIKGYSKNSNTDASFDGQTKDMTYFALREVIGV